MKRKLFALGYSILWYSQRWQFLFGHSIPYIVNWHVLRWSERRLKYYINRGKYFSRFLKFFPPTRKNSSLALCHLWGKTMQSLLKNCSFQSFLRVSLENLCKICLILQILLSYSLLHPKTLPKMVNSSKLFPPKLVGIKRNIYPWVDKMKNSEQKIQNKNCYFFLSNKHQCNKYKLQKDICHT